MEEKIILGDGKEYTIKPFNVGDFIEIEKKFGTTQVDLTKIEPIVYWFWLSIKKSNKDITLEKLYELIDAPFIANGGINKALEKLNKINGWDKIPKNEKRPAREAE